MQIRPNGTKSEEIIFLNHSAYNALTELEFRSRPKTSSDYWYADFPYEAKELYEVRLSSYKAFKKIKAIGTDIDIKRYIIYPIIVGVVVRGASGFLLRYK